jgi:hypothetical protein
VQPSGTVQELWERAAFGVACVEALAAHLEHDPTAPHVQSWRAEGAVVAGTHCVRRVSSVPWYTSNLSSRSLPFDADRGVRLVRQV